MAGFNGITGDEVILFADNASFDGTQRGGRLTSNGDLWIGSTLSPHVRKGNLTSPDGSVNIGYIFPNITLESTPSHFAYNYTNVTNAMSPYSVLSTDYYLSVDTSGGAVHLIFPPVPTAKQQWIVKDRTGNAAANNITMTGLTFDGQATYTLNSNYQAVNILANATPTYEIY